MEETVSRCIDKPDEIKADPQKQGDGHMVEKLGSEKALAEPSAEELEGQVVELIEQIDISEKSLTPPYWWLGETLNKLRGQFPHGEWLPYLESLGVNKTRWERAKAIRKTFTTPDECANLTVTDAYEQRERTQEQPRNKKQKEEAKPKKVNCSTEGNNPEVNEDEIVEETSIPQKIVSERPSPEEKDAFLNFAQAALIAAEPEESILSFIEVCNADADRAQEVLDASIEKIKEVFSSISNVIGGSND